MSRKSGIVNVRMVITEEKILSNIDKVQKLINPNSKKQIVQLEDDTYLKTNTEISNEPNILSKNVIAIDRKTQTVLYEKNSYKINTLVLYSSICYGRNRI